MTWEQKKQQSIAVLDKYKDEIEDEKYIGIKSIIGSNAIEDIFATEEDILNMVDIATGKKTADQIVKEYKKMWGVE
jgi:hypothetical protein